MSFFGFETSNLEQDEKKFLEGRLQESEDLAVYTWGEDSYDGLGDALQEGGDELNDETFGGTGSVGQSTTRNIVGSDDINGVSLAIITFITGKDFDFSSQAFPDPVGGRHGRHATPQETPRERTPAQERTYSAPKFSERGKRPALLNRR